MVEPCLEETAQDRELPDTRVPLVPVRLPESNTSIETEPYVTGPALPEHAEAAPDSSVRILSNWCLDAILREIGNLLIDCLTSCN